MLKIGGDSRTGEDCLTVNVFRRQGVKGKLPVAVYVHGGGYNRGTGEYPINTYVWLFFLRMKASMHNTASMVGWSEDSFVGVSFNYR